MDSLKQQDCAELAGQLGITIGVLSTRLSMEGFGALTCSELKSALRLLQSKNTGARYSLTLSGSKYELISRLRQYCLSPAYLGHIPTETTSLPTTLAPSLLARGFLPTGGAAGSIGPGTQSNIRSSEVASSTSAFGSSAASAHGGAQGHDPKRVKTEGSAATPDGPRTPAEAAAFVQLLRMHFEPRAALQAIRSAGGDVDRAMFAIVKELQDREAMEEARMIDMARRASEESVASDRDARRKVGL